MTRIKGIFCSLVVAALISVTAHWAAAQDIGSTPLPALSDYGISPSSGSAPASSSQPESPAGPPFFCNPCLYYSGNFDAANGNSNGLSNENDLTVPLTKVYTPFTVPTGHVWRVTAFFTHSLVAVTDPSSSVVAPKIVDCSVWRDVGLNQPGTFKASCAGSTVVTTTVRSGFGLAEYRIKVTLNNPIWLGGGTYWLNLMPQCTNPSNANCPAARFYEDNVADVPPPRHFGPANISNQSWFASFFYGSNYTAATGQGVNPDVFSFGVIGTCTVGTSSCAF